MAGLRQQGHSWLCSFPREKRFTHGSIYTQALSSRPPAAQRENLESFIQKIKYSMEKFEQEERAFRSARAANPRKPEPKRLGRLSVQASPNSRLLRLAATKHPVSLPLYDQHGYRTQEGPFRTSRHPAETVRTRSKRSTMDLPLNFNPGPGHYRISRFLDSERNPTKQ
jgi:hypothetical protein